MTQEDKTAVATVTIGGMHCPACAARVVKALKALPDVKEAEVIFGKTPGQGNFYGRGK